MAAPKGHPRYGGRKIGSTNKPKGHRVLAHEVVREFTREITTLTELGLPPIRLEDMQPLVVIHAIMVMRFRSGDYNGALYAAIALAPYTNPKLSSSEVRVTHELAQLSDEELRQQALAYEQRLAAAGETIDGELVEDEITR